MAFLVDTKDGNRDRFWIGGAAIIFWTLAAAGVASAVGSLGLGLSAQGLAAMALLGGLIGLSVGFYAALGRSRMASVLAAPGLLVTLAGSF